MPAILYTVGTWRVAREAYLDQFRRLGVKRLVDVRGNPRAGRQEELKQSRDFERALTSAGVTYEYWGRELGEDAIEGGNIKKSVLDHLIQAALQEPVCLLGHLHEPQGCHRLHLCDAVAATDKLEIRHLLWKDHKEVQELPHAEVAMAAAKVLHFFNEHRQLAEAKRQERCIVDPKVELPTVVWEGFTPTLFQDGVARRFLLPFDTELLWYPQWLSRQEADSLETTVRSNVTFLHPTYMFQEPGGGFTSTLIKRGQMRVCDAEDCPGAVASDPLQPWSRSLLRSVEDAAGTALNCFVANHYANGRVVINWHSDSGPGDDEGLGPNPHIGSVSLGAQRMFSLKSKRAVQGRIVHIDVPLTHGSLLVMGNNSQTHWLHALLPDEACKFERINLTFRFYARESTKHIEGMEHNHEWEAAAGSTRVKLHRGRFGWPVFVDIPDKSIAKHLPRYLSSVLHGFRGSLDVCIKDQLGQWTRLPEGDCVVRSLKKVAKPGITPEIQLAPHAGSTQQPASYDRSAHDRSANWPGSATSTSSPFTSASQRWQRCQGRSKGRGRGYQAA